MPLGFAFWLQRSLKPLAEGAVSEAENTVAPSISGDGVTGAEHTGSDGTWSGAEAYERRWRLNGTVVGTGATYTPAIAGSLVYQVRGQDENGVWSAWVNSTAVDIIALPSNDTAPVVTGNATIGVELAGSNGAWSGSPTITYAYQWQRSDDGSTGWSNISGATSIDYTLDEADEDKYVRLQVTATNDGGSFSAASNVIGPVLALAARTIVTVGHSLMDTVSRIPLMFMFPNETILRQTIPGAPLSWNWDHADEQDDNNNAKHHLAANTVDLFILAQNNSTPALLPDTVDDLQTWRTYGLGYSHSMATKWYWVWKSIPSWSTTPDFEQWIEDQEADVPYYTSTLLEIVADIGTPEAVTVVPGGEALVALVQAVLDAEVTDLTDPADLFSDDVHLSDIGRYFMSMVFYAAITGTTPVGLSYQLRDNEYDPGDYLSGVTSGMAADMQAIAWDVVSNHPFAGIAAWPDVPDAFTSGQWSLTAGDTEIDVTISTLPDSDQPITDVEYRVDGGSWASSGGTSSFTIGSLSNSTEYDIELRAVSIMGAGAASDTKSATPVSAATVPSAFTIGLWSVTAGDEEIDVTISSLPSNGGATITDIEYRLDGGSAVSSGGTTDFTITGLTNETEYDVEIRAVNSVGSSSWSDVKSATPEAEPSGEVTYIDITTASVDQWPATSTTGTVDLGPAVTGRHIYALALTDGVAVHTGGSLGSETLDVIDSIRFTEQDRVLSIFRCTSPGSGSQSYSLDSSDWLGGTYIRFIAVDGASPAEPEVESEVSLTHVNTTIPAVAGGLVIIAQSRGQPLANGSGITYAGFTDHMSLGVDYKHFRSALRSVDTTGTVSIVQSGGDHNWSRGFIAVSIAPA